MMWLNGNYMIRCDLNPELLPALKKLLIDQQISTLNFNLLLKDDYIYCAIFGKEQYARRQDDINRVNQLYNPTYYTIKEIINPDISDWRKELGG